MGTWEREDHEPKSLQIEGGGGGRRCRTPKSAPNSRPPSTTRSTASRGGPTSRRSSSQHPNPSAKGVEHVYETPKHHEVVVTSPTSSASRSSRLSNGFFRDSGNDSMYTSSGGSTDSSNQVKARRHSDTKWMSGPSSHVSQSASSTPKKSP